MRKLCYKWATKPDGNNEYQHHFRFKTGKEYEAMRYHFTSMAKEAEMDLAHNILVKFDCGVYVLKYMDIVNLSLLGKKNFTVPVWVEDELQRFREEFVERILYDGDNYYRHQAIKASNPTDPPPLSRAPTLS
ncbi:hypothetical protein PIB30_080044 [Stylosanthes scabra]|uniref:Uncharacterized protein n=1 Tax=Stylosanthes scabra TaxID=79078 RepID=A0ABU6QS02_9FABA|nr:hypothetical protein [Stylosanthes scabra]